MKLPILITLFFLYAFLNGQEFSTHFYFSDTNGQQDSILVGFDSTATFTIDTQFLESDISNLSLAEFDIRLAQISYSSWEPYCTNYYPLETVQLSQSKIDILPKKCLETIGNIHAFVAILIPNKNLPVTIAWDKSVFDNDCLSRSDLWTTFWIPPCEDMERGFKEVECIEQASVLVDEPMGWQVVNGDADTLSVLHLFLKDGLQSSLTPTFEEKEFSISPNPFVDELSLAFHITEPQAVGFTIFDLSGQQLIAVDLGTLPAGNQLEDINLSQYLSLSGMLLLQIRIGADFFTQKVIKL